ncbi:SIS domain-containing protein [Streptomyces sp. NPDC002763]|uniref:SIS domain-containing protein n=1 Tax=Streptomyces sp. NPDC002763 TaxID=3154427 RepID=UPI00332157C5
MSGRTYTLKEVERQTAALPADLPALSEAARAGAARVLRRIGPVERAVLLGSGDSLYAAQSSRRFFTDAGIECLAMPATEFLHEFPSPEPPGRTTVVGVSASGGNPAVVAALSRARAAGHPTVAVTGAAASPMADAAETVVVADPGASAPSPGIRTHQASLVSLLHLAHAARAALGGPEDTVAAGPFDTAAVARAQRRTLALVEPAAATVARLLAPAPVVCVVAPTGALGTARYLAAKLSETAGVPAIASCPEEWWHVHRFGHDAAHPVLMLLSPGPGRLAALETAARMTVRRRLIVVAEAGDAEARAAASVLVPVTDGVPRAARPLVDAVVAGPVALALARVLGRLPFARQ